MAIQRSARGHDEEGASPSERRPSRPGPGSRESSHALAITHIATLLIRLGEQTMRIGRRLVGMMRTSASFPRGHTNLHSVLTEPSSTAAIIPIHCGGTLDRGTHPMIFLDTQHRNSAPP